MIEQTCVLITNSTLSYPTKARRAIQPSPGKEFQIQLLAERMTATPGQPPARTDLRLVEQDWLTLLLVQSLPHIGINGKSLPALCRIQTTGNSCRPAQ